MTSPEIHHEDYENAYELMDLMIGSSQKPGDGNADFVETVGGYLDAHNFNVRSVPDPEYSDRSLLVVDFGPPDAEQLVSAVSHADVVGIEGQTWQYDPWSLTEKDGIWFGRGVCDTHGSGVAMLLAAARPEVIHALYDANKRISVMFTSDEEDPDQNLSFRGAKLAVGALEGTQPTATGRYFIAGEPTELQAKRAHKGRWLAQYTVRVSQPGHVAEDVDNAFAEAIELGHAIKTTAGSEGFLDTSDLGADARIFEPGRSSAQVTAATVKEGDFSITPHAATLAVDVRTLPGKHDVHRNMIEKGVLLNPEYVSAGTEVTLKVLDDFAGTITDASSPIVRVAEEVTGLPANGFNAADEGEVFRKAGLEGITLGPGELRFAHSPDEQIPVNEVMRAITVYSDLFRKLVEVG